MLVSQGTFPVEVQGTFSGLPLKMWKKMFDSAFAGSASTQYYDDYVKRCISGVDLENLLHRASPASSVNHDF